MAGRIAPARLSAVAAKLSSHGFDIVQPFMVGWYNDVVSQQNLSVQPLPTFGQADCPALLIANSKALWAPFLRWLRSLPDAEREAAIASEPLDRYTQLVVPQSIASEMGEGCDFFWSCDTGERLVAMQRVASMSSMAYLDTNTHLSVHPEFGTWFSLRAVVVIPPSSPGVDMGGGALPLPPPMPSPLSPAEEEEAREAMKKALDISSSKESTLCEKLHGVTEETKEVWRAWLAVREVPSVGKTHMFDPLQAEYHYTKNIKVLAKALESAPN